MEDNVDRRLVEHWQARRAANREETRFARIVQSEYRTGGSSAYSLDGQVDRARRHVRSRRSQMCALAPVIPLRAAPEYD